MMLHRIGRLDVTATAASLDQALAIRPELENLSWRLMPDVIARVFDRLAPPDLHVRIRRLDLDLGWVRAEHLELDLLAALERALEEALGRLIGSGANDPDVRRLTPAAARLERCEYFLTTGLLPPFDSAGRFDFEQLLGQLADEQPAALAALLRRRGRQRAVLERLVLQAGPQGLRDVLAALAPADQAVILALMGDILLAHQGSQALSAAIDVAQPALERLLWVATFTYLLRDAGSRFNRRRFLDALLRQEATRHHIGYGDLLLLLGRAVALLRARSTVLTALPAVLADLLAEQQGAAGALRALGLGLNGECDALLPPRQAESPMALTAVEMRRMVKGFADAWLSGQTDRSDPPWQVLKEIARARGMTLGQLARLLAWHGKTNGGRPRLPMRPVEASARLMPEVLAEADDVSDTGIAGARSPDAAEAGAATAADRRAALAGWRSRVIADWLRQSWPMSLESGKRNQDRAVASTKLAPDHAAAVPTERRVWHDPPRPSSGAAPDQPRQVLTRWVDDLARSRGPFDRAGLPRWGKGRASTAAGEPGALVTGPLLATTGVEPRHLLKRLAATWLFDPTAPRRHGWSGFAGVRGLAPGQMDRGQPWVRTRDNFGPRQSLGALLRSLTRPDDASAPGARDQPVADMLAGWLRHASAEDIAGLLGQASPSDTAQVMGGIRPEERDGILIALAPDHATVIVTDLRRLAAWHDVLRLTPVPARDLPGLLMAYAVGYLAGLRGAFDRADLWRHLLHGLAERAGLQPRALTVVLADKLRYGRHGVANAASGDVLYAASGDVAYAARGDVLYAARGDAAAFAGDDATRLLAILTAKPPAEPDAQARLAASRRRIEHFLRSGQPPDGGDALPALLADDPVWLAALIRRLATATPTQEPALLERLLGWLPPADLLDCLAHAPTARTLIWADGVRAGDIAAWRPIFSALLRDPSARIDVPRSAPGPRLDRLALIAHWLDHGEAAWWSPGPAAAESILAGLPDLAQSELGWLFGTGDPARSLRRLARATEGLKLAQRRRFLARLAPWVNSAALDRAMAGLPPAARLNLMVRATAASLAGDTLDLAAFAREALVETPSEAATPAAPPDRDASDGVALHQVLAWLDGAPATERDDILARAFTRLADADDAALRDYLARGRQVPGAAARWAKRMPREALGRLLHLLVPDSAEVLLLAVLLLDRAWHRVAPRRGPADLWPRLLTAVVEWGGDPPRRLGALIEALGDGDDDLAERLLAETERLARQGGHYGVLSALRRAASAGGVTKPAKTTPAKAAEPGRRPSPPRDRGHAEPIPPAPDPAHGIYISNAGLVLFSPYLPSLFQRLGVLSQPADGPPNIKGVAALSRAVHLLQYLVDARLDQPEPLLVLNKLLCGAPTGQPIEARLDPDPADLAMCDGLLTAVIGNWPIIKNTSVAGLRETFLQRDGRLLRQDTGWSLRIQRRAFDVLVDHVPWSFSMIYHRWMTAPIMVTW